MISARCGSCNTPVVWVITPLGKRLALNAEAVTCWRIDADGEAATPRGYPVLVHAPHAGTCAKAEAWRRKGG